MGRSGKKKKKKLRTGGGDYGGGEVISREQIRVPAQGKKKKSKKKKKKGRELKGYRRVRRYVGDDEIVGVDAETGRHVAFAADDHGDFAGAHRHHHRHANLHRPRAAHRGDLVREEDEGFIPTGFMLRKVERHGGSVRTRRSRNRHDPFDDPDRRPRHPRRTRRGILGGNQAHGGGGGGGGGYGGGGGGHGLHRRNHGSSRRRRGGAGRRVSDAEFVDAVNAAANPQAVWPPRQQPAANYGPHSGLFRVDGERPTAAQQVRQVQQVQQAPQTQIVYALPAAQGGFVYTHAPPPGAVPMVVPQPAPAKTYAGYAQGASLVSGALVDGGSYQHTSKGGTSKRNTKDTRVFVPPVPAQPATAPGQPVVYYPPGVTVAASIPVAVASGSESASATSVYSSSSSSSGGSRKGKKVKGKKAKGKKAKGKGKGKKAKGKKAKARRDRTPSLSPSYEYYYATDSSSNNNNNNKAAAGGAGFRRRHADDDFRDSRRGRQRSLSPARRSGRGNDVSSTGFFDDLTSDSSVSLSLV